MEPGDTVLVDYPGYWADGLEVTVKAIRRHKLLGLPVISFEQDWARRGFPAAGVITYGLPAWRFRWLRSARFERQQRAAMRRAAPGSPEIGIVDVVGEGVLRRR